MEQIGIFISRLQEWWIRNRGALLVNKTLRQYRVTALMERTVNKLYALETFRQTYCDRDKVGFEYCLYRKAYDSHLEDLKSTMFKCLSELEPYNQENCQEYEQE